MMDRTSNVNQKKHITALHHIVLPFVFTDASGYVENGFESRVHQMPMSPMLELMFGLSAMLHHFKPC